MPNPEQVYDAVVRALEAEVSSDPNPDSPVGADARLSSFAQINPDVHDEGGFNRHLKLPSIDVTLDRQTRQDAGGVTGEWTGEWDFDTNGNPRGRIFAKQWRVRVLFTVFMWAGDDDHTITGLDSDLTSVLNRFDTKLRGDFLVDENGTALQGIQSVTDLGGENARGTSNTRAYDHELEVEFTNRIPESEYGPTPHVANVLFPSPGEHHGDPETPESDIVGDVPQDRIDAERSLSAVSAGTATTVGDGDVALVRGTFTHDGTLVHDGTVEFLPDDSGDEE